MRVGFPAGKVKYEESMMAKLDPAGRLAVAILNRAALDWRMLICKRAWQKPPQAKMNFTELRQFFHSQHCAGLCRFCEELTAERMLQLLERELAEAVAMDIKKAADR